MTTHTYTTSQNKTSPSYISRSLIKHCSILIIFGRNIPQKMQLEGVILFLTSPNWCFCTTWWNYLKQKSQISSIFYYLIWSIKHQICPLSPQKIWGFLRQCTVLNKFQTFAPVCASSQIFSPLMATDTISDLLKVEWGTKQTVWRDVPLFGPRQKHTFQVP